MDKLKFRNSNSQPKSHNGCATTAQNIPIEISVENGTKTSVFLQKFHPLIKGKIIFFPTITSHYPYSSFEEIKWQNFSQSYMANELYRRNIAIRIHIKEALLLGNIHLQEISWSPLFIHFLKKIPSFHNRSCSIFKNESMESFVLSDFLFENIG